MNRTSLIAAAAAIAVAMCPAARLCTGHCLALDCFQKTAVEKLINKAATASISIMIG